MPIEHHDLVTEFPKYKELIRQLKQNDYRFKKLYDEYQELTNTIEKMEKEIHPASTHEEEELKLKRVNLKDQLYKILMKEEVI